MTTKDKLNLQEKCKHETITGFTKEGNLTCCDCGKVFRSSGNGKK